MLQAFLDFALGKGGKGQIHISKSKTFFFHSSRKRVEIRLMTRLMTKSAVKKLLKIKPLQCERRHQGQKQRGKHEEASFLNACLLSSLVVELLSGLSASEMRPLPLSVSTLPLGF